MTQLYDNKDIDKVVDGYMRSVENWMDDEEEIGFTCHFANKEALEEGIERDINKLMMKLLDNPSVMEFLNKKSAESIYTGEFRYSNKEIDELIKSIEI